MFATAIHCSANCGDVALPMITLQKQMCFAVVQLDELMSRLSDVLGLSSLSLGKPNLRDIYNCTQKGQRSDGC